MVFEKILIASLTFLAFSCSGSSGNKSGGNGATATATTTTDANGVVNYSYDPASTTAQTVEITNEGLKGSRITFAPGTLSIAVPIEIEEGASSAATVATALGGTEVPLAASSAIIIRPSDTTLVPKVPLSISLPLSVTGLKLAQDKLVVVGLYYAATGLKAGILPTDKLKVEAGKASFSVSYFGQYQLAYLTEVPATLEANATQDIVTKRESAVKQSVYILGTKKRAADSSDDDAGVLKDNVWTQLENPTNDGNVFVNKMQFKNGKLYVVGSIQNAKPYGDPDRRTVPGYWVDYKWNALPLPEGQTDCYDIEMAFDAAGKIHVFAYCGKHIDMKSYSNEWVDGVSTEVMGSSDGFMSDKSGNIYRTISEGYTINGTTHKVEAKEGYVAYGALIIAPNGDKYLGGYNSSYQPDAEAGYWLNDKWVTSTLNIANMFFSGGSDPIIIHEKDRALFMTRSGKETALDCKTDSDNTLFNTYVYNSAVDRDGVVHSVGGCAGPFHYWKNGVGVDLGSVKPTDILIF